MTEDEQVDALNKLDNLYQYLKELVDRSQDLSEDIADLANDVNNLINLLDR